MLLATFFGLISLPAALGAAVATDADRALAPELQHAAGGGSCHAVVAASSDPENVAYVRELVPERCRLFVYDVGVPYEDNEANARASSHLCNLPPLANTQCTVVPNLGREFGKLYTHLLSVYADPPEWTLLIPSNLHRHNRSWHLEQMLRETVLQPAHGKTTAANTSSRGCAIAEAVACQRIVDKA